MSQPGNRASSSPQVDAVDAIIDAWRRHDIDTVLDQLHDDVVFTFAIGQRPAVGKARVRQMLEFLQGHQTQVRWRTINSAQNGDMVFTEGVDDYVNPAGHRVQTPHATVFEFDGDKIVAWRDYYDQRQMEQAEAGEPLSEWGAALVADDRPA
ncbi:nuclear transport factor 2 family protein [Ilumatobacter coccineus]|uniref:SnoaL-like domain-containing protein n=1 Tax=Ilumatobacter coccineus (strain NBRC 103263 / KCTC 29153 / YM16-304) TaxID=1313172 RepID=A0A6C7E6U2_ILUCY|nr:nuclear transport factor 2 family protein [Ilumatobacter coccineus]BAN00959.1 hypothetical protein YM304_06450 [Ilumatobacter coccineus YM16-304]